MTSAPTTPDSPLNTDLPCAKCHYNLRTKRPSERCPECAHSVADSLRFQTDALPRAPLRAVAGAICLAFYGFLQPVFTLAWILLFYLIPSHSVSFVTRDVLGLLSLLLSSALLITGILIFAQALYLPALPRTPISSIA